MAVTTTQLPDARKADSHIAHSASYMTNVSTKSPAVNIITKHSEVIDCQVRYKVSSWVID